MGESTLKKVDEAGGNADGVYRDSNSDSRYICLGQVFRLFEYRNGSSPNLVTIGVRSAHRACHCYSFTTEGCLLRNHTYCAHLVSLSKKRRLLEVKQETLWRIVERMSRRKKMADTKSGPDSVTLYAIVQLLFWISHFPRPSAPSLGRYSYTALLTFAEIKSTAQFYRG